MIVWYLIFGNAQTNSCGPSRESSHEYSMCISHLDMRWHLHHVHSKPNFFRDAIWFPTLFRLTTQNKNRTNHLQKCAVHPLVLRLSALRHTVIVMRHRVIFSHSITKANNNKQIFNKFIKRQKECLYAGCDTRWFNRHVCHAVMQKTRVYMQAWRGMRSSPVLLALALLSHKTKSSKRF